MPEIIQNKTPSNGSTAYKVMRDILNLLETVLLTEKSRGLLYRDKGDQFFQGKQRTIPQPK
jgi:hypothetical protein